MQPTHTNSLQLGGYTILSPVKQLTNNQLFTVYKTTVNPVYILKIYTNHEGYLQEKKVYQIQQIFGDHFVEACENKPFQNRNVDFIVTKYSKYDSLMEFLRVNIGLFPLKVVKYYMFHLFSQLKFIHITKKIPFRTLYTSDVIVNEQKDLIVVGWTKMKEVVKEQELIFDCAEVMYYMITNGSFQQLALGYKGNQKRRFLSQEFWDVSKKKSPYLRYFPTNVNERNNLINFMQKITVKDEVQQISLEKVLNDEFFTDKITRQQAYQELTRIELQKKSKQKLKEQYHIKRKMPYISNIPQSQQTRCSHSYEKIVSPFLIQIDRQQLDQVQYKCYQMSKQHKKEKKTEEDRLYNLLEQFLITRLEEGLESMNVFNEDWISISKYQIFTREKSSQHIVFEIKCQIKYNQEEDVISSKEQKFFILEIIPDKQLPAHQCIKDYSFKSVQNMHEVLLQKLQFYITEGLKQSFKYSL